MPTLVKYEYDVHDIQQVTSVSSLVKNREINETEKICLLIPTLGLRVQWASMASYSRFNTMSWHLVMQTFMDK